MQVISNFSLKKIGKTQKTGVSYSVLLLIDSYLDFSVLFFLQNFTVSSQPQKNSIVKIFFI